MVVFTSVIVLNILNILPLYVEAVLHACPQFMVLSVSVCIYTNQIKTNFIS